MKMSKYLSSRLVKKPVKTGMLVGFLWPFLAYLYLVVSGYKLYSLLPSNPLSSIYLFPITISQFISQKIIFRTLELTFMLGPSGTWPVYIDLLHLFVVIVSPLIIGVFLGGFIASLFTDKNRILRVLGYLAILLLALTWVYDIGRYGLCNMGDGLWSYQSDGSQICFLPADDAGKICNDSSQCQNICEAPPDSLRLLEQKTYYNNVTLSTTGKCTKFHPMLTYYGGYCYLENGEVDCISYSKT